MQRDADDQDDERKGAMAAIVSGRSLPARGVERYADDDEHSQEHDDGDERFQSLEPPNAVYLSLDMEMQGNDRHSEQCYS